MSEQTPIPADPLAMPLNDEPHAPSLRQVRDLGRTQWGSYIDATEDDGFHDDPRYVAACRAADMVPLLVDALDRAVAAGRTAAAADIRTEFERIPFVEDTELNQGSATALVEYCAQLAEGVREPVEPDQPRAARVAENGAAHSCSNCDGVDPASCFANPPVPSTPEETPHG